MFYFNPVHFMYNFQMTFRNFRLKQNYINVYSILWHYITIQKTFLLKSFAKVYDVV